MAANNLEDLLQEALADFEDTSIPLVVLASSHEQNETKSAATPTADARAPSDAAIAQAPSDAAKTSDSTPALVAPKGLGLGLRSAPALPRRARRPAGAASAVSDSKAEDAILGSSTAAEREAQSSSDKGGAGGAGAKLGRPLPADAQRLADDLINLLQEAGLAEGPGQSGQDAVKACFDDFMAAGDLGAGLASSRSAADRQATASAGGQDSDDPFAQLFGRILGGLAQPGAADGGAEDAPPPEFASMLQQMMMGPPGMADLGASGFGAGLVAAGAAGDRGTGAPGPSGAPADTAADDDDALSSSRLAGLAQRTRKTVSEQAKKTRGHVEGGAVARPAGLGGGPGGGALGPGVAGGLGAMLRELGGLGVGGPGGGGGEGASAGVNMMVDYIMQNLLSKDVLYGPLKEIRDRYPPWLEANQGNLPPDEYKRYAAQYESVQRVCLHYEMAPSDFGKLMELIQEMQTYGDPPGDIVEEMTGGAGRDLNSLLSAVEEESTVPDGAGQPALDELTKQLDKCPIQ